MSSALWSEYRERAKASPYAKVRAVCRQCSLVQSAYVSEFRKAGRARCGRCGGVLDRASKSRFSHAHIGQPEAVPFPKEPTEFEVQSFLYQGLRRLGYVVRGEVRTALGAFRLDLVIYLGHRAVKLIEVKARESPKGPREEGREKRKAQLEAYRTMGLPVESVCGMTEAERFLQHYAGLGPHDAWRRKHLEDPAS